MNIRLSGVSPEFAGFTYSVRCGRVTASRQAAPCATETEGLSRKLVEALGGAIPGAASERSLEVDQTNRSVIVDERWIVKHIDIWGTADRSSRIERALADAGSRDVPGFLGALEWEHPELGTATIALVSEFVPHASDGWTWAADDALAALGGEDPVWPARVGELVARVHADLSAIPLVAGSGGPLSTERSPAGQEFGVARRRAAELTDGFGGRSDATARRMLARIPLLVTALDTLPADWLPSCGVIHGDLHVGQTIRTPAHRYLLLDFDGDPQDTAPATPRAEPRERDLAHLLNSIDLVAAVAQKRRGCVIEELWGWAERAGDACLRAYRETAAQRGLPALDERALPALRAEQLVNELRYAQRYLPEWEYAPDGVISFRYPAQTTQESLPWTPPVSSTT